MGIYGWFFEEFMCKQGLDYVDNGNGREAAAEKVVFDENGGALNILNEWKKLYDAGYAPNVGRGGDSGLADFSSGKAAITLGSTASLKQILQDVNGSFEVGTAYFPSITDDDKGGVSIGAGRWCGGPMYYLAEGLGGGFGRALAVLFACFCVLASFGMGNMSQINSIAGNLQAVFRVPPVATGIVLALLTGRVILGGLKRVAAVTEAIVPLMALFYLFGALTVVCVHWAAVPAAFAAIFRGAFGLQAAGGGVLGYGMARAISWGFKRGAFSNEAGLGASVLVHCAANVEEPVQQGMWGMFEVFADTMVVCTLTALVVLTSGLVDLDTGAALTGVEGSALVGQAFSTVFGAFGPQFIAVSVLLFAYSTTLGWSHYGTRAVVYLLGERAAAGYKLVFAAMVLVGAVMKLDLAWALSDTFNGLMMLPNLVGVVGLSGVVVRETQAYLKRK